MLKVFKVIRVDHLSYCEDWGMIVVACDHIWAEKLARQRSDDFRKAKIKKE